jgi:hypothetical protein
MKKRTTVTQLILLSTCTHLGYSQFVEQDIQVVYEVTGIQDNEQFSLAPAAIGDINADGIPEILCTAPGRNNAPGSVSACILLDGATGAEIRTHERPIDSTAIFQKSSDAGDLDADGVMDYAVGGWNNTDPGAVFAFSGVDGTLIFQLGGLTARDQFGLGLASLDDINADGHDDLLVGSPFHVVDGQRRGRIAVYSGADGSVLWSKEGDARDDALGQSCFSIDDINADGIRDVAVAAPQMRLNFFNTGPGFVLLLSGADGTPIGQPLTSPSTTSVFFGGWIPSPRIDLNSDGVNEIIISDQFDAALGSQTGKAFIYDGATRALLHTLTGTGALQGLGATTNAGDLNADGTDDLVVTSWRSPDGAPGLSGKLSVLSGADLTSLGTITSTVSNANFGGWVLQMGDVDADGIPDFFTNAPQFTSKDGPNRGRYWIISGATFASCRPDLTGEGDLNFLDVSAFLTAFANQEPAADFNPDGNFNFLDVSAFLAQFAQGCP